jgi:hypothetical protein
MRRQGTTWDAAINHLRAAVRALEVGLNEYSSTTKEE